MDVQGEAADYLKRDGLWIVEVGDAQYAPVSYTHLDVYKRQLFALIFKNAQLAQHDKQLIVTIEQIAKFIIPGSELSGLLAIRLGEIYRHQHTYKFRAFGDGYHAGSEQVARSHGLDELPQTEPDRQVILDTVPDPGREKRCV